MTGVSARTFDDTLVEILKLTNPARVLDIGPGQGKFARLIQQAGIAPHKTALEIDETYVQAFKLREQYDEVRVGDAGDLPYQPKARNDLYDFIFLGDCIEHLPKSRGLDLINFLNYRCGWMVLISPEFYFYEVSEKEYAEAHISCWSEFDFQWHDRFAYMRATVMQLFILRGYQATSISLEDLIEQIHVRAPRVLTLEDEDLKAAKLDLFVRHRTETIGPHVYSYRYA